LFWEVTLELAKGFSTSLSLFVLTLLFSLPLGLIMMFALRSKIKPIKIAMEGIVLVIRGTPLMLQLLIVFFVPGILWGSVIFSHNRFLAALVTFTVNYAAYFAVIYKGGFESIPRGQFEAGQVLGLSRRQIFQKIILLQIIKQIMAPMSNEVITLVKDTSLVRVIAVVEIIKVAERYTARGLIWPLFYTGAFYLIFSTLLSVLFNYLEKKLAYFETI